MLLLQNKRLRILKRLAGFNLILSLFIFFARRHQEIIKGDRANLKSHFGDKVAFLFLCPFYSYSIHELLNSLRAGDE